MYVCMYVILTLLLLLLCEDYITQGYVPKPQPTPHQVPTLSTGTTCGFWVRYPSDTLACSVFYLHRKSHMRCRARDVRVLGSQVAVLVDWPEPLPTNPFWILLPLFMSAARMTHVQAGGQAGLPTRKAAHATDRCMMIASALQNPYKPLYKPQSSSGSRYTWLGSHGCDVVAPAALGTLCRGPDSKDFIV